MSAASQSGRAEIERAIAELQSRRNILGDAVVAPAVAALRDQLETLDGASPGRLPGADDDGEYRLVTVIFADLAGFTALAGRLSAEELRDLVNACFERLVPVLEAWGGTVDKFVGDAVVALFGAPRAHEDDAERALRASLDMRAALEEFNRTRGNELALHIGIDTGRVVAGGLGGGGRRDYTVIGHHVNVAARLEDASAAGEILVGPDTHRLTRTAFEFEPLPPLAVKGLEGTLTAYRLVGPRAAPEARRGISGLRSPLVGRDRELDLLLNATDALTRGEGALFAVEGDVGQGKSRLSAELRDRAPEDATWIEVRALSHAGGIAYGMARQLLAALVDAPAAASAEVQAAHAARELDRLERARHVTGGGENSDGVGGSRFDALLHLFGPLPADGATAAEVPTAVGDPEVRRRRILRAFVELVEDRARERSLVLVWEDLHWADDSSLGVLETLIPLAARAPLLLLLLYRPDEGPAAAFAEKVLTSTNGRGRLLRLEPLRRTETELLLDSLVDAERLSTEVRARILEHAEGNAFFLEEVLRSLVDSGAAVVREGRVVPVGEIRELHVPETLEGVILARVDRLDPEPRRVLQTAAVLGRIFPTALLVEVVRSEAVAGGLERSLEDLRRRELVREVGAEDSVDPGSAGAALRPGRLIFKHAVTQQVAYESLLARRRAELHRRAGEAVEVLWPERLDEEAATLGYHFERGGVPARAAACHARAADRARAAYANVEAIGHYSAALAQLEELDRRAPAGAGSEGARTDPAGPLPSAAVLSEHLGDVLLLTGRQEEAREAHARALELVPEGDAFAPARLLRKQAHDCEVLRDIPRALGLYEEAERSLPESGDAAGTWWREWLEIRLARAWAYYFTADWRRIAEEVEAVRPVVERDGSARQRNLFFQRLVLMAFRRERYVVAAATLADAETALSWARQTGDPVQISDADFVCGLARLCRRDLDAAELHLRAALDWADRTGDNLVHCRCLTYLSLCSRLRGDVEATRTWTRRAMESARAGGRIEYIATGEANEAWLAWRAGDPATACARGLEALELWGRSWAEYPFQWSAVWPLVAAEFGEGRLEDALEHAKLLVGSSQQPLVGGVGRRINLALTAAGRGEPDLAVEELGAALRAAPEVGYL